VGRALRGSSSGYWGAPCSPTSGKSPHSVQVARAGGCSVQGPLSPCVLHARSICLPVARHGASASPPTQREHLWSCTRAHRAARLAVHAVAAHLCAHTHTHMCAGVCARRAGRPARVCRWVCTHAEPRCAGTPGLRPRGAGVPSTIRSLAMLELASCRRLCSVPASRREGVGSRLAEFLLIITQVVTKSGTS